MYKFSAPMPYTKDDINKILDINKQVEKSKITSLYFSLPYTCELFTGFEQDRNKVLKNWDYWKKLIEFSLSKNTDLIYLLNSPRQLNIDNIVFAQQLEKLDRLLFELKKLGINKLRIAEHKLMSYIADNYNNFEIYASTSFEFKSLMEYQNFIFMHSTVKQIVPSHDSTKNFKLLKNLKKLLPNIEIELIVNEGCINGCPNRIGHASEIMSKHIIHKNDINLSNLYFTNNFCIKYENQNPILAFIKSNKIFPWEIQEYNKIGINKFKLVGRDAFDNNFNKYIQYYKTYLKGVEDYKNIENTPIHKLVHHLPREEVFMNFKVNEIRKYLPDIKFFRKHGELCSVNCSINCNYCYNCAAKLQKFYKIKQLEYIKYKKQICYT